MAVLAAEGQRVVALCEFSVEGIALTVLRALVLRARRSPGQSRMNTRKHARAPAQRTQ